MRRSSKVLIAIFFTYFLGLSCTSIGDSYRPIPGLLYNSMSFDGDFNPQNTVRPLRFGKGCVHHILRIYSWGDAAAGSIAWRELITKISYIDHSVTDFFIFYGRYCTYVYGE
ncbi:TRL-like family protein [Leptospira dzoumogneensis]|uniref:TRL-like family protein n=2 Tax=Leptospira dzoumogneensis TaxID=2484904 RepID=A0A4Z1AG28_9LEPT|nr:TRL-like family protein [Leptospira dzoumogneensis]